MKLEFSRQAFEKYSISNFMKIRPMGAELFPADGPTDVTKLIVGFSNFANAPKNLYEKETSKRTFCEIKRDSLITVTRN
jgi:hypothetical protein